MPAELTIASIHVVEVNKAGGVHERDAAAHNHITRLKVHSVGQRLELVVFIFFLAIIARIERHEVSICTACICESYA